MASHYHTIEMDAIGGYFELELKKGRSYHPDAIKLNSARNCLESILIARKWTHIFIPYYSCEALLQPLKRLKIEFSFYHINTFLEPTTLPRLKKNEAFLYINYFGLKERTAENLATEYGEQLIIDNSQAFYSPRVKGIDTFYSPRKFFGVPDGGYLYSDALIEIPSTRDDTSWTRMKHLCQRIEFGPETGYLFFREAEEHLDNSPIKKMSLLTQRILESIDYEQCATIRRSNYSYLFSNLSDINQLDIKLEDDSVPMIFPFLNKTSTRQVLLSNRIYVASYWRSIYCFDKESNTEYLLAQDMAPLPIDQRYSQDEMNYIIKIVRSI